MFISLNNCEKWNFIERSMHHFYSNNDKKSDVTIVNEESSHNTKLFKKNESKEIVIF